MTSYMLLPLLQEKATCENLLKQLESSKDNLSVALKADADFAIEQVKARISSIETQIKLGANNG